MIASHPSAAAVTIFCAMYSNAASSTRPLGGAPAAIGRMICAPTDSHTAMNPPSPVAVPRNVAIAPSPSCGTVAPCEKRARSVTTGENVFVSWLISATMMRMIGSGSLMATAHSSGIRRDVVGGLGVAPTNLLRCVACTERDGLDE